MSIRALSALLASGPVHLPVGIGGGGQQFAAWLGDRLDLGPTPRAERTDEGVTWNFRRGRIVDSASMPPRDAYRTGMVRIEPKDARGDAGESTFEVADELASEFFKERSNLDELLREQLLTRFRSVTSIADVPGWEQEVSLQARSGFVRRVETVIRKSDSFREYFRFVQSVGGSRLLDLGRVIYLLAPDAIHLGDEWASLASANSSRVYSLADINLVLSEFSEFFYLDPAIGNPTVEARTPFVRTLFSGFVPASSSEYVEIFNWMSGRAVGSLVRSDSSDEFIKSALPLVAVRAGCLPQLLENGAAMLAADTARLADYLERDPDVMVEPGAKALLLHAHRLHPGANDREAQMEFALRRLSLNVEADRIAAALPARAWRPVWSITSPTNVHRVLSENASGVLSLAVAHVGPPFRAYAGHGNGLIRLLRPMGSRELEVGYAGTKAEIRGLAALELNGEDIVVAAASDATIRAFRVRNQDSDHPEVMRLWAHQDPHMSPLTTATIWQPADGGAIVLSAGVSGRVWRNDAQTGADLGPLVEWGAEVRSIRTVSINGASAAVVAAVDGRIAVIDLDTLEELATTNLATWRAHESTFITPSCMDAIEDNGGIRILVGCAMGEVFEARWSHDDGFDIEMVEHPGVPRSGVNEVSYHRTGLTLQRYVARNDGVWLRYSPDDKNPVKVFVGHSGPVLSQALITDAETAEVLTITGGSEGNVRIWRHIETVNEALAYLRVNRHRGAIRSVEVRHLNENIEVITGGDDGDVRVWQGAEARRGWVISHHQGSVSSFLWVDTPTGSQLVVGAQDGTIRIANPDRSAEPARLLGIAHEGVTALAASPSNGIFWSAGNDGGVTRWDALAGVARGSELISRYGKILCLATDTSGRVYAGGQNGALTVIDPDELKIITTQQFDSAVTTIGIIPEQDRLVLGLASGHVHTMNIAHGLDGAAREIYRHESGAVKVDGIELHDQVAIASVGRDRKLVVIDVDSRAILHEIGLEGLPTSLSASGNFIAVSTTAGATLFEFSDGRLLTSLDSTRR